MTNPRVFVSSTCYDLRYIRERLSLFIKTIGFEPVLSEKGNVPFDPNQHRLDSVLAEVSRCQMFVLIIGGRFGNKFKNKQESIVNYEYREAIQNSIPVFALVESAVHAEYNFYQKNKENKTKINYSEVDSTKIFDFMEEVEGQMFNNALFPFSDIEGMESYLRQQWAGLMFELLTTRAKYESDFKISAALAQIESLSREILGSFAKDNPEKVIKILNDILSKSDLQVIQKSLKLRFSLADVLDSEKIDELFAKSGIKTMNRVEGKEIIPSTEGLTATVPFERYSRLEINYGQTRGLMLESLKQYGWERTAFFKAIRNLKPDSK